MMIIASCTVELVSYPFFSDILFPIPLLLGKKNLHYLPLTRVYSNQRMHNGLLTLQGKHREAVFSCALKFQAFANPSGKKGKRCLQIIINSAESSH